MVAWDYHEHPRPGVLLLHVSDNGDKIWTVRAGTQRHFRCVHTYESFVTLAINLPEGYVRFTIRSNIEYMVADEAKVQPLIDAARIRRIRCWRVLKTRLP